MPKEKTFWEQNFDEGNFVGKYWRKIRRSSDGPIAQVPVGQTVIFPINPQPPVGQLCQFVVRKTKGGSLLGQWTGKKK
jgi:hypothetical protein